MTSSSREPAPFAPRELTAVIFAGASGPPAEGGRNKNFFMLGGRPVVQRQLDLVRSMGFGRSVLVTEPARVDSLELPPGVVVLPSSPRQSDNFAAVKRTIPFAEDQRCLVLFGDTPLVTPGVVKDFLARCASAPADVHHGLVPHVFVEPFMEFFPRDRKGRTPIPVREFTARLGCLSLARPAAFDPDATRSRVSAVMSGRKQDPGGVGFTGLLIARTRVVWGGLRFVGFRGAWMGVAAILSHWLNERGFPEAARFTRRPVSLSRLDDVTSKLLACTARLLPCPFGGASLDVDTEVDLAVHQRYFEQMSQLTLLQERLARELLETDVADPASLASLERKDPAAAAEIRRHPEVYREQQRILRAFATASARATIPVVRGGGSRG